MGDSRLAASDHACRIAHNAWHCVGVSRISLASCASGGFGRQGHWAILVHKAHASTRRPAVLCPRLRPRVRGWRSTVGRLIEICWAPKKPTTDHNLLVYAWKNNGVRFHRIRDFKQLRLQLYSANLSKESVGARARGEERKSARRGSVSYNSY